MRLKVCQLTTVFFLLPILFFFFSFNAAWAGCVCTGSNVPSSSSSWSESQCAMAPSNYKCSWTNNSVNYCCCPGSSNIIGYSDNNGSCSYYNNNCDQPAVQCGSANSNPNSPNPTNFVPQVTIPGSSFQAGQPYNVNGDGQSSTRAIAEYLKAIYKYLIGIVGIVGAIMLMVGGITWLTAGGAAERVKQAQEIIKGSLTGIVLALSSFLILGTINPALVNFKVTQIKTIEKPDTNENSNTDTSGCCAYVIDGGTLFGQTNKCTTASTQEECVNFVSKTSLARSPIFTNNTQCNNSTGSCGNIYDASKWVCVDNTNVGNCSTWVGSGWYGGNDCGQQSGSCGADSTHPFRGWRCCKQKK